MSTSKVPSSEVSATDPLASVERLLLGHSSGDPSLDGPLLLEVERVAVRLLLAVARGVNKEGLWSEAVRDLNAFAAGLEES